MSKNTNNANFVNKQNIKILWDVLLGELNMKNDNTSLVNNIRSVFESNISPFTARMNPKSSLMDLNKLFLSQVVVAVNRLFPNLKQQQQMRKINISDEVLETSFNQKLPHSLDFVPFYNENIAPTFKDTSGKTLAPPLQDPQGTMKKVDFTDKNSDEKITEMQLLIAETMAKRNFEVEQFEISNNSNLSSESETWLQSTNTSVKTDRQNALKETTNNVEQRKIKYNSFLQGTNKKKVTWTNDSNDINNINDSSNITLSIEETETINVINDSSHNILNKLKKVTPNPNPIDKLSTQIEELNNKFDKLLHLLTNNPNIYSSNSTM